MFNNNGNTIPRNGLIMELNLDGNRLDTSGNGYNGTASNVTYVKTTKGYQAQAGSFNGSSSKIDTALVGATNNFSISIWRSKGDTDSLIYSCYNSYIRFTSSGNPTAVYYDGNADRVCTSGMSITDNNLYHIVWTKSSTEGQKIYVNGILRGTQASTNNLSTSYNSNVGIGYFKTFNGNYHLGQIQLSRYYNRVLSQDEIQLLYLEGLRKLGPTNIASYPKLFEGLVGYFENPISTELWNIATGVKATYVGGINTTDNLGINKAITNPNYTWSSITYTTGYTFENDGTGWAIKTSPSGLSATGINRTTTLRNVFLFNRTLSAYEVTTLQALCNSDYIYPSPSYDLLNLRDGLVLDLNEQGKDLSGNGNNGTLVNAPQVVRQGKTKGLSYNGSNQYLTSSYSPNITSPITFSGWYKTSANYSTTSGVILGKFNGGHNYWVGLNTSNILTFYVGGSSIWVISDNIATNDNKWHKYDAVYDGTNIKLYRDGILKQTLASGTCSPIGNLRFATFGDVLGYYFNGNITSPKIRNRALSAKEIEQLYYSQKRNFVY